MTSMRLRALGVVSAPASARRSRASVGGTLAVSQDGAARRRAGASEAELAPEAAEAAAATPAAGEAADEVGRAEPELLEEPAVLVRVDLVGELLVRLVGLALVAALGEQGEDLVL